EPDQRGKPVLPVAGLMNLAVSAGQQTFQITPSVRLGGERIDLGQTSRSPFVQIMKPPHGVKIEDTLRLHLHLMEERFELSPIRPFSGHEPLEIDDHFLNDKFIAYCDEGFWAGPRLWAQP